MVADPSCPLIPVLSDNVVTVTKKPTMNSTIPRKTIRRRISPVLPFFSLRILGLLDVRIPPDGDS